MGSGGVAIAALPTVICLKVPFSDGLGGGMPYFPLFNVENGGISENIYIFASSDNIFYMEQEL